MVFKGCLITGFSLVALYAYAAVQPEILWYNVLGLIHLGCVASICGTLLAQNCIPPEKRDRRPQYVVLLALLCMEICADAWILGLARRNEWLWVHQLTIAVAILLKAHLLGRRIV